MDSHPNLVKTTVAVAPSPASSGTTLSVPSGHGSKFSSFPFNIAIWPAGEDPTWLNCEIGRLTGQSGDVLTFSRAQEGTSARAIIVGDNIAVSVTQKNFTDIETAISTLQTSGDMRAADYGGIAPIWTPVGSLGVDKDTVTGQIWFYSGGAWE